MLRASVLTAVVASLLLTAAAPLVHALPTAAPLGGTPQPAGCAASQEAAALLAADAPGASLQSRIDSVLPTPAEERFLAVPWRTNLMAARREAQAAHKPLFLWIMVGNPQGCT